MGFQQWIRKCPIPIKSSWALMSKQRISLSIMQICFSAVQLLTNLYWYSIIVLQKCVHAKCSLLSVFVFAFDCCAGYKVIKKIGEGTFSEVSKTQSLKDGKFYACKTMKQTINRYVFCNEFCLAHRQSVVHLPFSAVYGHLKLEAAARHPLCLSILLDVRLPCLWPCSDEVTIDVTAWNVSCLCTGF